MKLVQKVEGAWHALARGRQVFTRTVSTCSIHYHDGRVVHDAPCEPYDVSDTIDIGKAERLVRDGVWTTDDLAPYGVKVATLFEVPAGKQTVGAGRHEEDRTGVVREVYDVEDIPPLPPEPNKEERLQQFLDFADVTADELRELLAAK